MTTVQTVNFALPKHILCLCRVTTTCTCKVSPVQFYCLFLLQLFNFYYSLYYIQSNPADTQRDFLKQRYRFWIIQIFTWLVGPTRIIIRLRLLITCMRRTDGNGTHCQFCPSKTHTVWEGEIRAPIVENSRFVASLPLTRWVPATNRSFSTHGTRISRLWSTIKFMLGSKSECRLCHARLAASKPLCGFDAAR